MELMSDEEWKAIQDDPKLPPEKKRRTVCGPVGIDTGLGQPAARRRRGTPEDIAG